MLLLVVLGARHQPFDFVGLEWAGCMLGVDERLRNGLLYHERSKECLLTGLVLLIEAGERVYFGGWSSIAHHLSIFILPHKEQMLLNVEALLGGEVVSRACDYSMLSTTGLTLYRFVLVEDMTGAVLQKTVILIVLFANPPQRLSEVLVGKFVYD